ncbi:CDGSH iron-sulfur domain-containing protein [Polynucleobacter sp. 15G-AUS-farblos]|uniref:CDGSH iron-sulfur domain-containing protein n=1 Tax=Polynucleobacter sp. 15G-AUS-farblos TaxID=2689094 RepID=UPI001C0CCD60|nr:CDGSH iron-sulfur domain-containing protein [Polynucleobacter sp. 15G-AUS-farblos]
MKAKIAQLGPFFSEIDARNVYAWCGCGKSQTQPYCDNSHLDTGFQPVKFSAFECKKVYFCGCKQTSKQPFCDATCVRLQKGLEDSA